MAPANLYRPLQASQSQQAHSTPSANVQAFSHQPLHPPPTYAQSRQCLDENEPPWVRKLIEHIDRNDAKIMNRIDQVEGKLTAVCQRVSVLESEMRTVHTLNDKVHTMEEGINFMSKDVDELKQRFAELRKFTNEVRAISSTTDETQRRLIDLESRSMRQNLIFENITETPDENPEQKIQNLIQNKMGIKDVKFDRVHRTHGERNQQNKPRPIVARFTLYKQREEVRMNAKRLAGTNIGVHEQFSKEINQKRRILHKKCKEARANRKYARVTYDYLIVENEKFKVDNDGNIYRDPSYTRPPPPRRNNSSNDNYYRR